MEPVVMSPPAAALLDVAAGALLLTAVLVVWRRDLPTILRIFTAHGLALGALVGVLAWAQRSVELGLVTIGVLAVRGGLLPWLLRRALAAAGPLREVRPVLNVAASLLAVAALVLLAFSVSVPLVELGGSPATRAVPVAVAVVLIGLLVLVTRRHTVSQLVGFLLVDNGITAAGFLTTSGIGLVVEVGVALDVLLVVLVLQVLAGRIRDTFGDVDLGELRELRDR
jgi:hydrogenase-4 component E